MGIVQGVAFGFLANSIVVNHMTFKLESWIFSITTLLVIVVTWHEYVIGVVTFDWVPSSLDALIPFLLGGTEVWLAVSVGGGPKIWLLGLAAACAVGFFSFLNMYVRSREYPANLGPLNALGSLKTVTLLMILFFSLVFLALALISDLFMAWPLAAATLFLVLGYVVFRDVIYWRRLKNYALNSRNE